MFLNVRMMHIHLRRDIINQSQTQQYPDTQLIINFW